MLCASLFQLLGADRAMVSPKIYFTNHVEGTSFESRPIPFSENLLGAGNLPYQITYRKTKGNGQDRHQHEFNEGPQDQRIQIQPGDR